MTDAATSPAYSVIVPAFQAAATIAACLDALEAQTVARAQFEIIVVDDGSTDGTGQIATRPGVKVIVRPHAGAAAAGTLAQP